MLDSLESGLRLDVLHGQLDQLYKILSVCLELSLSAQEVGGVNAANMVAYTNTMITHLHLMSRTSDSLVELLQGGH